MLAARNAKESCCMWLSSTKVKKNEGTTASCRMVKEGPVEMQ
jgi:hypothetical protein